MQMNRKYLYIIPLLLFLFSFSCKNNNQSSRAPISHRHKGVDMKSVNMNKELNNREETYIEKMIKEDSLHQYIDSHHGFWYYYISENEKDNIFPREGDKVTLKYEIKDLSGNTIYSFNEIGEKIYHVDHENYFRGFREAVKLLKKDEEAEFLFPSNAAYGYHGDEKKIGNNVPLKVKIKILKIKKTK